MILLGSLLLLSGAAQAQFGVKAGVNAAVLDGTNLNADTKYKTYYHVGIFYQIPLLGPLTIQPEIQYSEQGGSFKSAVENFDTKLHYFTVPVLAKLTIGPVFVEAGPQIGVLFSAQEKGVKLASGYSSTTPIAVDGSASSDYHKTDISLCAGAGLKLGSFLVGGRFNAGLNNVNDAPNLTGANDPRLHNRVVQAYVGFQFGGK